MLLRPDPGNGDRRRSGGLPAGPSAGRGAGGDALSPQLWRKTGGIRFGIHLCRLSPPALAEDAPGACGYYNRYYLTELEDGSWLCVYFDDYLTLTGGDEYPTGYLRYTTTEERRALSQMQADYDLDPVYVLDMYRHGKVSWMLDVLLRLAVLAVVGIGAATVRGFCKRRKSD